MRTLGILLIILAHVNPPKLLFNIRTFDVPLMALLLGSSFILSTHNVNTFNLYLVYLRKRFIRLIVPAWKFITLFFVISAVFSTILKVHYVFSIKEIILTYTLISGFGYVWIIRIFFVIAIVSPLLVWLINVFDNIWKEIILVIGLIVFQEGLFFIHNSLTGSFKRAFELFIATPFAYIIAALVGMIVIKNFKSLKAFVWIISIMAITFTILYNFGALQNYKYPPNGYFISYSLAVSTILFYFFNMLEQRQRLSRISYIEWISKKSMSLYYWHIFFIYAFMYLNKINFVVSWWLEYILIITLTITATLIVSKLADKIYIIKIFDF